MEFEDTIEPIKKYFYPNYLRTVKEIEPLLSDEDNDFIKSVTDELKVFIKNLDNIKIENVVSVPDNFNIWVRKLFKMNCFRKINQSDNEEVKANCKRKYVNVFHRYIDYKYLIEPPLMNCFLQDLFDWACDKKGRKDNQPSYEIKENDFEFKNILRAYIAAYTDKDQDAINYLCNESQSGKNALRLQSLQALISLNTPEKFLPIFISEMKEQAPNMAI